MANKYTPVTSCIVFYFIVRLYIYRYFCRCLFDRFRGTKIFHKILRGTSAKKVKKHWSRARCKEKLITPRVKHPRSKMIWEAMPATNRADLYSLPPERTMNGSKYVELFKEKLVLHMEIRNCTIFMHNEACIFLAELMRDWLITLLITRSSLLLEILGRPDLLLSLKVPSF